MKPLMVVIALVLAGCSTVSPRQSAELAEAADRYARITLDMTKDQLVQLLGAPRETDQNHCMWELSYGRDNFESLSLRFNSENQITEIRRVHGRYSFGTPSGASYQDLVGISTRPSTHQVGGDYDLIPLAPEPANGFAHTWSDVVVRPGYSPDEKPETSEPVLHAQEVAQLNLNFYRATFVRSWHAFEDACRTGNARQIERLCDRRVLDHLPPNSLQEILGTGWRADRMLLLNQKIILAYRGHQAEARVEVELTENGRKHTERLWWILDEKGWKCQNLPFSVSQFPAAVRNPPEAWD